MAMLLDEARPAPTTKGKHDHRRDEAAPQGRIGAMPVAEPAAEGGPATCSGGRSGSCAHRHDSARRKHDGSGIHSRARVA